jgi:peptidoglycan/LPS O-acetylase OafA/YrhL
MFESCRAHFSVLVKEGGSWAGPHVAHFSVPAPRGTTVAMEQGERDAQEVEISVLRWAVASFLGCVGVLALASIPLVAVCVGAGSPHFRHAALAAVLVAAACLLGVVLALDLLGARARRNAPKRRTPREVGRLRSRRSRLSG